MIDPEVFDELRAAWEPLLARRKGDPRAAITAEDHTRLIQALTAAMATPALHAEGRSAAADELFAHLRTAFMHIATAEELVAWIKTQTGDALRPLPREWMK